MTTNPHDWTPGVSEYRAADITMTREDAGIAIRNWALANGLIQPGELAGAYVSLTISGDNVRCNFAWKEPTT